MASKGLIFFALGSVFGGLLSATTTTLWPQQHPTDTARVEGAKSAHKSTATRSVVACKPCASESKLNHLPDFVRGIAKIVQEDSPSREILPEEAQEVQAEWTDEDSEAFAAQELALYQQRRSHVDMMREDLAAQAGFSEKERERFAALVEDVSKTLDAAAQKVEKMLGPLPTLQGGDEQDSESPESAIVVADRRKMLQIELSMTKALLNAQTRYEALLGEERFKELGAQFGSIETFIQESPPMSAGDSSVKGG